MTTESLPVLDIGFFDRGGDERTRFLAELRQAARGPGFFYLTGHGIAPDLIRSLRRVSKLFFALPDAHKLAIAMVNSPHFRGYNRAGLEHTRGKPDWREQIDIGPEKQVARLDAGAPAWTRLQGPNQWPDALPALRPLVLEYQQAVTSLAIRVLHALAAALEQPEDVFQPIYTPWVRPPAWAARSGGSVRTGTVASSRAPRRGRHAPSAGRVGACVRTQASVQPIGVPGLTAK